MMLHPSFTRRPLAHRGLHDSADGRPENSLAAARAAVAAGYGIELDVQPSSDGVPMVFHDYELDRLTAETGAFSQRSAEDLARISLKGAATGRIIGGPEGIPTLAQILALVSGQVPLLIEIKDQDGAMGADVGALEQAVALALADYAGPVAVMSFNPHSVAAFGELAPLIARGLVTSSFDPADWAPLPPAICDALRDIPDYERVGASFISHEVADLDRARVAELKAAGADILCWTVRSAAMEAEARQVAGGITFEGYLA